MSQERKVITNILWGGRDRLPAPIPSPNAPEGPEQAGRRRPWSREGWGASPRLVGFWGARASGPRGTVGFGHEDGAVPGPPGLGAQRSGRLASPPPLCREAPSSSGKAIGRAHAPRSARLTGTAPACVSGEGWGLRRCHGCEVSKAVWEGAGRGHGSSGHPSRQRKKTRDREGLDPRAKGEPCPYLRVGVSGKLATGLEFPRGALEASEQLHQVHRPASAPRLIREERKYMGRQKPELGSPTPLNPGTWMPGDSG